LLIGGSLLLIPDTGHRRKTIQKRPIQTKARAGKSWALRQKAVSEVFTVSAHSAPVASNCRVPAETGSLLLKVAGQCCAFLFPLERVRGNIMTLHAPNIALFVVAFCLAILGVLSALPIALPIPGLAGASAWYIFLAWFLLAAGSVVPQRSESKAV